MNDKWQIKGVEFSNCNCDYGCPCQFNAPTTHGNCEAIANAYIEQGYFNETVLDGLSFVLLLYWPGEIAEGNGKEQLIIDERADQKQREAIKKIALGESTAPGSTHYYVFNSTMSEVLETLYAPIDMSIDIDNRKAKTVIDGIVDSRGSSLIDPFSGNETRRGIHNPEGFEYTYAEMGSGTSRVNAGISLNLSESYGQFNILHMNQDGVIRS